MSNKIIKFNLEDGYLEFYKLDGDDGVSVFAQNQDYNVYLYTKLDNYDIEKMLNSQDYFVIDCDKNCEYEDYNTMEAIIAIKHYDVNCGFHGLLFLTKDIKLLLELGRDQYHELEDYLRIV